MQELLDSMWQNYLELNPQAQKVYELFTNAGEKVVNDHIAFRTFQGDKFGIDVLAKVFLENGYSHKGEYNFPRKKLFAKHFEPPIGTSLPKIFISELIVNELKPCSQKIIEELLNQANQEIIQKEDFLYSGRHWEISYSTYLELLEESEYAAWLAAFGFRPNHFTISLNHFKKFKTLEETNTLLKKNGIQLNSSGGEIKGGANQLLAQSSTLANRVEISFSDQKTIIPSCYYEFALRYNDENGKLFQGFVTDSADKIFESTDRGL